MANEDPDLGKRGPHGRLLPGHANINPAGRGKGVRNKSTTLVKDFARRVLEDGAYRLGILQRARTGTLAPQVEVTLYHYAYGKPVERVQIDDRRTGAELQHMSPEELKKQFDELVEQVASERRKAENDDVADLEHDVTTH